MKTYNASELAEIIKKHGKWLRYEEGGERADLSYSDLSYSDLSCSNLSYINLSYSSSLNGATGNMFEIKSVQCDLWPITYTADRMQIGCQFYLISEWWAFSDDEIAGMDSRALAWWTIWKPILKLIIETSPAVPGRTAEETENA